jgi:hypothetical protein
MASCIVVAIGSERRLHRRTARLGMSAARLKSAARRRVDGVRRIARQRRLLATAVGVHRRHGAEQRAGIGMPWFGVDALHGTKLDYLAQIHDEDAVAHVLNDIKIVRDEDIGEGEVPLEIDEQVEHLRLDRLVERGNRLVEDDELRLERVRQTAPDRVRPWLGSRGRVAWPPPRANEGGACESSSNKVLLRSDRVKARRIRRHLEGPARCAQIKNFCTKILALVCQ